jgi:hypothetical protein
MISLYLQTVDKVHSLNVLYSVVCMLEISEYFSSGFRAVPLHIESDLAQFRGSEIGLDEHLCEKPS